MRATRVLSMFLALAATSLVAIADEMNKETEMTFTQPVEVPGAALPAGTYVFKLLDSMSDRNIVLIFDKDQKELFATIMAVPDYRVQPTGDTKVYFEERAAGAPEAIKAWFYPGDTYGEEFVYPQAPASDTSRQTNSR